MKSIILFLISSMYLFGCSGRETYPNYFYSPDGLQCITFLQFHPPIFGKQQKGIFIVPGKYDGGVPDKDYVFVDYCDAPFFLKWEDSYVKIRMHGFTVYENKLTSSKIDFLDDYTTEEKIIYGYSEPGHGFFHNIKKDFEVYNRLDLAVF